MQGFKHNGRWWGLNLTAAVVMTTVWSQLTAVTMVDRSVSLVDSGKWAARFLLISLAMTPINTLLGWREAVKLRKPAGLWAFGFGVTHLITYIITDVANWRRYPIPDWYAALGVIALIILALLAATSTRWAMKRLGKGWKRLHRLVYAAGILALVHGLLETANKRVMLVDPLAAGEIQLYLVILGILLLVRIPALRGIISQWRYQRAALH